MEGAMKRFGKGGRKGTLLVGRGKCK